MQTETMLAEQEQLISKARYFLLHLPFSIQPDEPPNNAATKTFNAQSVYVRNRLKRHQAELVQAWGNGCLTRMLEHCGLRENLVSPDVAQCCLCELEVEKELRRQLFYRYRPAHEKFDPDAPNIEQLAAEYKLTIVKPNTERGHYAGIVVGLDYRAALIKFADNKALELPLWVFEKEQRTPCVGDALQVRFSQGVLTVKLHPGGAK